MNDASGEPWTKLSVLRMGRLTWRTNELASGRTSKPGSVQCCNRHLDYTNRRSYALSFRMSGGDSNKLILCRSSRLRYRTPSAVAALAVVYKTLECRRTESVHLLFLYTFKLFNIFHVQALQLGLPLVPKPLWNCCKKGC